MAMGGYHFVFRHAVGRRWLRPLNYFAVAAIGSILLSTVVRAAESRWISKIEQIIHEPAYEHARWGVLVADLKSGEVLYEHDADKLFAPASTTKLYSVGAALAAFGPNYTFETPIYAQGQTNANGDLQGNLILVASGDLTLGGRTDLEGHIAFKNNDHTYANGSESGELTDQDPLAGINELARQIAAAGIKSVHGDVAIDTRLFDPTESTGSGPSKVTPILVNDNLIDILITPATAGSAARVITRPECGALQINVQVDTVASNKDLSITINDTGHGKLIVQGQIPMGHRPLLRVAEVDDSASFARSLLIEALERTGVRVAAPSASTNRPDLLPADGDYRALSKAAVFRSPPFREEVKLILKVSHNLHASTLPLLLAAQHGQRSLAEGLHFEREFLENLGVNSKSISFGGGAGGARSDFTTPRATVQLLRAMAGRPEFEAYKAGLPIIGQDGTLSSAVAKDSSARGKVTAKTGTLLYEDLLNNDFLLISKALAGYMTTSQNRELAFALFVNDVHLQKSEETTRIGQVLGRLSEIIFESL